MRAGLRVGDSVVEAGGQLVLFMEQEQVERLLQEDRLQIALTVERWSVGVKCIITSQLHVFLCAEEMWPH